MVIVHAFPMLLLRFYDCIGGEEELLQLDVTLVTRNVRILLSGFQAISWICKAFGIIAVLVFRTGNMERDPQGDVLHLSSKFR